MTKTRQGRFFEDFRVGEELIHAPPRTLTTGDAAVYTALTGSRFAVHAADAFAQGLGLPRAPIDDLLAFHVVFGQSVADVSLNAVANLGYADGRFLLPVYPGDTLGAVSEVIGLRENSNRRTGVVHVRTTGRNDRGEVVLSYVRWVMVRKRDPESPAPEPVAPTLPEIVPAEELAVPPLLDAEDFDAEMAGADHLWDDYEVGEKIDHVDGMTVEEAEHRSATRLYHNTARIHFNQHAEQAGPNGRCLVYGGHVISLARALSFNGLGGILRLAAINAGRHIAPCFAGDTVYAWSEVLDKAPVTSRDDLGALRLRLVAAKDRPCADFPHREAEGYAPGVVLDLDYWALLPRRA